MSIALLLLARIGFVSIAPDESSTTSAIERMSLAVSADQEFSLLPDGAMRRALLGGAPDPDAAAKKRAQEFLSQSQKAYRDFAYDQALALVEQAIATLLTVTPEQATDVLAETHLMAGLIRMDQGDTADALAWFRLVHLLRPNQTALDPAQYKRRAVQLYEQAAAAPTTQMAALSVSTEPEAAQIWIDGHAQKPGERQFTVTAESHLVTATLPGHAVVSKQIQPRPGETLPLTLVLPREPADKRAQKVRSTLGSPNLPRDQFSSLASELADIASCSLLVFVRQTEPLSVLVFDARTQTLPDFSVLPTPEAIVEHLPKAFPSEPLSSSIVTATPRPWYGTGWGIAALLGGAAAVTAGVLLATSQETTQVQFGQPRWVATPDQP